jgi:hypothetical protein
MPIMDAGGHVLCGGGGLQGSLDGAPLPFATYGGGCWYDDRGTALEQLREGALDGTAPKAPTLAFWRQAAAPALLERGANDFAGGGGAYVAWLAGYGVFGSLESRLAGTPDEIRAALAGAGTCGPHSVAPDGTIGYCADRQNGYGLTLVAPGGRALYVPGVPANAEIQVLEAGVAIWRGGAVGRPVPRPTLADAQGVQLQAFAGADWLLYWSEARGCVLQRDGDPYGVILDARPLAFNPHLRVVGAELWICWSTTQGEGPGDLVVCALSAAGQVRYVRQADGVAPAAPLWCDLSAPITTPPIEPPIEPPPVKPPIEPPPTKPPITTPPTTPPAAMFPPPIIPIEVSMTPYNVAVVGPNGLYGSVDPSTHVLVFDRLEVGPWETFTLEQADDRGRLQFTSHSAPDYIIGVDTTEYGSNDIRRLFYMKPITNPDGTPGRGNYESFFVGKTPEKLIVAMIEYIDQGVRTVPYAAPNLTVVQL